MGFNRKQREKTLPANAPNPKPKKPTETQRTKSQIKNKVSMHLKDNIKREAPTS